MNIMLFKEIFLNRILFTYRTDITDSRSCRFFHDISQLSGQHDLTFSRHNIDFNLQGIASYTCPCKSTHNSDLRCCICHLIRILFFSKKSGQIPVCYCDLLFFCHQQLFCRFPADSTDLTFQLSDSCLFRTIMCHFPDCFFTER